VIIGRTVIAQAVDRHGQRCHTAQEANEMLVSPKEFTNTIDSVDEPMAQPGSAAPAVEAPSTEVLIATQQVAFSTAAAVGVRRANVGGRITAMMRRMFATSTEASGPRPGYEPKRYGFLENSVMAREMERL
jgi:hypothetical protein